MKRDLYSKELSELLDKFVREMYRLNRADNPKFVGQLVIKWTRGQLLLTKKLLQYLLEEQKKITVGQEAAVVEKLVRTRLIKEFKQDDLTLPIRQLLYAQNLSRLLTVKTKINRKEQAYLNKLQQELGLSDRQCRQIKEQYFRSQHSKLNANQQSNNTVQIEPELYPVNNSYQDLIELVEKSPIYEELIIDLPNQEQVEVKTNKSFFKRKFFWIGISIPLLLLIIFRQINWQKSPPSVTAAKDIKLNNNCSTAIASPQMSLGTKLLSITDSIESPEIQNNLEQATSALANCKYDDAETAFQRVINSDSQNAEVLIYLNNTIAMSIADSPIADHTFKIAVTVSFERQTEIAREILQGVAKAQQEINRRGGINSKPLLVQIVNLPTESDSASKIVRKLTADQNVLAVIGHDRSNASLEVFQIYQEEELTMISPTSTNPSLSNIGDRIFRTAPDIFNLANTLYSYTVINSMNKIAVCADSRDSDSSFFARKFINRLESEGGEVAAFDCNLAQKNFNPASLVEKAIAENADAILLAPGTESIERAISLAEANQQRLTLLGNHILFSQKTLAEGLAAVEKMVLPIPWLPTNAQESDKIDPNWRATLSYNATLAIIQGLKQTGDRQELYSVLRNPDFAVKSATGIQFAKGNKAKVRLAYIDKSEQSEQYQFLPLKIDN